MEHESDGDTNSNWSAWYNHQKRIGTGTGGIRNKRTSGDHPNNNIVEIDQDTKKIPENLRLAITHIPVKDHQLTLV